MAREMTKEEEDKLVTNIWKALNKRGIYNEEQLDEAIAKQEPLDLTPLFIPVEGLAEEKKNELRQMASKYKVISKKDKTMAN